MPMCQCPDCKQFISATTRQCIYCGSDTGKYKSSTKPIIMLMLTICSFFTGAALLSNLKNSIFGSPVAVARANQMFKPQCRINPSNPSQVECQYLRNGPFIKSDVTPSQSSTSPLF